MSFHNATVNKIRRRRRRCGNFFNKICPRGSILFIEILVIHASEFIGARFVIPLMMIMFRIFIFFI